MLFRYTPLDYALMGEHLEVAQYMIEQGALSITGIQDIAALKIQVIIMIMIMSRRRRSKRCKKQRHTSKNKNLIKLSWSHKKHISLSFDLFIWFFQSVFRGYRVRKTFLERKMLLMKHEQLRKEVAK